MISRIRERLGTAGLVVAVIALVAALAGGAYAASGGLTGKQKKEVKAIAKSFQGTGPAGAAGPAGPAGAAGKDGSAGAAGAAGTAGAKGATGATGNNGVGVTATALAPEEDPECEAGGSKFEAANGTTYACNGDAGATGPTGPSCNMATGYCEAPSGATLTGAWAFRTKGTTRAFTPISYPLRLQNNLTIDQPELVLVTAANAATEGAVPGCPGKRENPKADPGKLCVYVVSLVNTNESAVAPFSPLKAAVDPRSGVNLEWIVTTPVTEGVLNEARGSGTWAVGVP